MIAPSRPAVLATALAVVPLCTMAVLMPRAAVLCWLALLLFAVICALDAQRLQRRMRAVRVNTETEAVEWFRDRPVSFILQIQAGQVEDLALAVALPVQIETEIAVLPVSGERMEIACTPKERGRFQIRVCHLSGRSPWKLWHGRVERVLNLEVRVYPDLEAEAGAKLLFLRRSAGLRQQRLVGRGREFERLREYTHGDSFDEIYWKGTARRGKPVVKVFQVERTQDVYVVVDSSRLSARNGALEQFVSAALMVALATEKHGDNFGLLTFSDRVDHFVPAARGRGHYSRCREAIYAVQPRRVSPDFSELFTFLQLRVRKRALLLFLTDLSDPLGAEMFARDASMLAKRHLLLVNRLTDEEVRPLFSGSLPESIPEIGKRLSGHLEWSALKELERSLSKLGVSAATLRPGTAGLDLVAQYENVKRRQLI